MVKENKKPFKKEYIPVIIALFILIILIAALVFVISYNIKMEKIDASKNQYEQDEVLIDNSNSKCSKDELTELYNLANNITVETNMVDKVIGKGIDPFTLEETDVTGKVTQITLKNVDSKLYAYINNNYDDVKGDYIPENNIIVFTGDYTDEIVTYTLEVRANDYACKGETVRKFTISTPIYNSYFEGEECKNYPDFKYCKEYLTEDFPSLQTFNSELDKYKKELNKSIKKTETSNINNEKKDNKSVIYIVIGGIVLIIGVAIVTTILVKKRRSRNI